jgi:hypothetical protein
LKTTRFTQFEADFTAEWISKIKNCLNLMERYVDLRHTTASINRAYNIENRNLNFLLSARPTTKIKVERVSHEPKSKP